MEFLQWLESLSFSTWVRESPRLIAFPALLFVHTLGMSIVAKVVRDRAMHRLDGIFPAYGFATHVGYITPGHSALVRRLGRSSLHRRSFDARCYAELEDEAAEAEVLAAARA